MPEDRVTRREFVRDTAVRAAGVAAAVSAGGIVATGNPDNVDTSKILNYTPEMEYRCCGKTGLMISAIALGGHWKRIDTMIGGEKVPGWMTMKIGRPEFQENRYDIVSRCIERGFTYVDGWCRVVILAYSNALEGRRD
jgi:hypothetical protein